MDTVPHSRNKAPGFYSKAEYYTAARSLCLGNVLAQWTVEEFAKFYRCMTRRVSIRSLRSADRLAQHYRLPPRNAMCCIRHLQSYYGYRSEELLIDESAPDKDVVLQMEVCRSERYLDARYCLHSGCGMRQAYSMMRNESGLYVAALLHTYLDSNSDAQVQTLLVDYPNSVIELSTYPYGVGVLKWNTLIWEVRNY